MALSRGSRRFLVIVATLAVLGGVGVGGTLLWVNTQLSGVEGPGDPVELVVASGATASSIGEQLVSAGVVRNALVFRLVARSRGLDAHLQAGTYALETGMSVDEAIDALLAGPALPPAYRFTIPEGLTVAETLVRLAEQTPYEVADFRGVLDARLDAGADQAGLLDVPDWVPPLGEFGPDVREPFEGLLFPQTYEVLQEATPLEILQRMVDELGAVVAGLPADGVAALGEQGLDLYDAMIIASLVERESKVAAERTTIAAVIRNRLDLGMLLQIDASVLYAQGTFGDDAVVDTTFESAYNTYAVAGLPPTPISGARAAALEAAVTPADVSFLYYVVAAPACDGTHLFADTLAEHNRNVAAYRSAGRCR